MTASLTRRAAVGPVVDIVIETPLWDAVLDAEKTVNRAIATAATMPSIPGASDAELTVVLTDDKSSRALNHRWRGIDKPTNVLSFPAPQSPVKLAFIGDIVIAYETLAREALAEGKSPAHHLAHLAVHGFLHLMGYDHESDAEAELMEQLERAILARLDVPDPYATHEP